jgi:hypothetical protein
MNRQQHEGDGARHQGNDDGVLKLAGTGLWSVLESVLGVGMVFIGGAVANCPVGLAGVEL